VISRKGGIMGILNLNRMKKSEILWLYNHRCRSHGRRYVEHPTCYFKDKSYPPEKIGYFDIEAFTNNFNAQQGLMLCYCIKEQGNKKIHYAVNTKEELLKTSDRKLLIQCVKDLQKFDKIYTYYGTRFDIPWVRTKCLMNDLDFLEFGELLHRDMYYTVRNKLSLKRNTLENADRVVNGVSIKTHYDWFLWLKAVQGNWKALKKILEHCKNDVISLEQIQQAIAPYTRKRGASI